MFSFSEPIRTFIGDPIIYSFVFYLLASLRPFLSTFLKFPFTINAGLFGFMAVSFALMIQFILKRTLNYCRNCKFDIKEVLPQIVIGIFLSIFFAYYGYLSGDIKYGGLEFYIIHTLTSMLYYIIF